MPTLSWLMLAGAGAAAAISFAGWLIDLWAISRHDGQLLVRGWWLGHGGLRAAVFVFGLWSVTLPVLSATAPWWLALLGLPSLVMGALLLRQLSHMRVSNPWS